MFKKFTLLLTPLLIACTGDHPSSPVCRVDQAALDNFSGNAGCIIRVDNRMLTTVHRFTGRYTIPGGTAGEGESSQCTAHRETWEETGFNVEVGRLLGTADNGFRFYHCKLDDDFEGELDSFPVPAWSASEVNAISLIDPFETTHKEWRYQDQLVELREMFVAAGE